MEPEHVDSRVLAVLSPLTTTSVAIVTCQVLDSYITGTNSNIILITHILNNFGSPHCVVRIDTYIIHDQHQQTTSKLCADTIIFCPFPKKLSHEVFSLWIVTLLVAVRREISLA